MRQLNKSINPNIQRPGDFMDICMVQRKFTVFKMKGKLNCHDSIDHGIFGTFTVVEKQITS